MPKTRMSADYGRSGRPSTYTNVTSRAATSGSVRIRSGSCVAPARGASTGSSPSSADLSYCRNQGSDWVDYGHTAAVSSSGYASGRVDIYTRK